MADDWQDNWDGQVSSLGPNPYGFDGSGNSKYAPQPQQAGGMGGGTLAGLAQALMKYGSSSGGTNLNGGGVMPYDSSPVDYGSGYVPIPDYTGG
jgi:hypothetical protein